MPQGVSEYVLKICGLCDLSCDHCYVYEHADQSWQRKPKAIAEATVVQAARRISEHARQHKLSSVSVVLHGGEPLLLGPRRLRDLLAALRREIDPVTRLFLTVHTNGVRLTPELCDLFSQYQVRVGVSLDGDLAANDRHRRFANGRSSHALVLQALELLRTPKYRHLYAGILCTVDVANDPLAVYQALLAERPPRLDLLLPHATWDSPPPGGSREPVPYARWLGRIHSQWVADGYPVPIRLFDSLLAAGQGRTSGSEATGLDPVDLLVIETDGSWEQADSLKTAFDGAPATGCDVFSHSADEAAAHPGVAARRAGLAALAAECRACPLVASCGGGLFAHRYSSKNGFANPSVYCEDLKVLIPQVLSAPRPPYPGKPAPRHELSAEAFDLLASGPGDPDSVAALADARYSATRAVLALLGARLGRGSGVLWQAAVEGWRLLSRLDVEHPAAVREILTYPYVQSWAVSLLRRAGDGDADLDRAHLAGIAAAAAFRAGTEAELAVPLRAGYGYVPAVGAFAPATGSGPVTRVRITPSGLSSPDGIRRWRLVRRVTAAGLAVTVDDLDPFRHCEAWPPTDRLSAREWTAWRRTLTAAATQLAAELPAYASVLGAGLRSVVPMLPSGPGLRQSGSARQAYGAVAIARPEAPASLGELLLHEMQHGKLAVLADLFELFDLADQRRFRVGWRADERPIDGVLHGAYAHLAVAELWRSRAQANPDQPTVERYRDYRSWVEDAIGTMLGARILRPAGERFVEGMHATVKSWADD
jgi:uncharacterized protein